MIADASLGASNAWTVAVLRELGARRVTAAYDVDRSRLLELAEQSRPDVLEVVLYQHLPMFHTEHCVCCAAEMPGASRTKCGRPCRRHDIRLLDRYGESHRVLPDACCRNTVFHARPRDWSGLAPELRRRGVRHFRIELLDDAPHETLSRLIGQQERDQR